MQTFRRLMMLPLNLTHITPAFLVKGSAILLENMLSHYNQKLKLNANVIEVNYSDEQNNIVAYVEDGAKKTVTTNAVLVTAPLGVLKAKTINFIQTYLTGNKKLSTTWDLAF